MRKCKKKPQTHIDLMQTKTETHADIVQTYQKLMELTVYLKDNGINNVYVAEIVKRGCFVKSPGLANDSFNKQRNKINRLLKGSLKDNFINLRVNFPKDYDNQIVHFNQCGLYKQFFAIRRPFLRLKN